MPSKPNIMFVLETGSLAGGVRVIGELANRLARLEYPVSVYSVNPRETLTSWFPLSNAVKWHSFFKTGTIQDYYQLAQVLKKQNGRKIATFWRTAPVVAEASKDGEGVYLVQDIETSYTTQPVRAQEVMRTYSLGLEMVTTSRWVEKQIKSTYIGIGLDNVYRPKPKVARQGFVLACGRMQNLKGYDILCEVGRYIARAGGQLVTYGVDKELPTLVKHQHFSRPKDEDIIRMYQQAGVFLSTSRHEGFNLTALEAMATGCPVVTTDSHGNAEYIEHDGNCLISSDPYQLASYCVDVINDKDLGKRLGENGIKTAAKYRWKDVVDRLEAVL